jgi:dTDP-glucose 4,6-dehydratase
MRAVVTGAAGFLGSHLCDAILDRGGQVLAFDNFSTGHAVNLHHLLGRDEFFLTECDVTDPNPSYHYKLVDDLQPTHIFHLASLASPTKYIENKISTLLVGAEGTRYMLDLATMHGARFIMASTSEVYGDPEVTPQPESYWGNVNSVGPRSCYDESKRYAEALCMAYQQELGTSVGILRLFNTFGPRMSPYDGRAVPTFVRLALDRKPMTITGDGTQTRSLCYVSDTIEAFIRMAECGYTGPINIGNPEEITMVKLARTINFIANGVDYEAEPVFIKDIGDDPKRRCPDIYAAKQLLYWKPTVNYIEGLTKMIQYERDRMVVA